MRLAITGLGLMTSVGHDVHTACASIRAGIQRPHELTHFFVLDTAEQKSVPLIARPVAGYTDGFVGIGLWLRLARAALQDLRREARLPDSNDIGFWSKTALLAVTPELAAGRFDDDEEITAENLSSLYVDPLVRAMGWPIVHDFRDTISIGHAGAVEAVKRADALLRARAERVIIVCADSLLDAFSLEWLAVGDRLKNGENPFGVVAGEAGASFMLESETTAMQRGAPIIALVSALHLAKSGCNPLAGDSMIGDALAQALGALLATEKSRTFAGICICDINGEPWRSQDWGAARVRLGSQLTDDIRWLFPCESLGETGCASGAVALCVGSQALRRGYANCDSIMITSTSDSGTVGALCLHPA
jgi:3-oxoacyl-[acyl-carrier-protein] synthase-1